MYIYASSLTSKRAVNRQPSLPRGMTRRSLRPPFFLEPQTLSSSVKSRELNGLYGNSEESMKTCPGQHPGLLKNARPLKKHQKEDAQGS